MIKFLILFIVLYLIPASISYVGVRYEYKNKYDMMLEPDIFDFLSVVTPAVNVGVALLYIFELFNDKLLKPLIKLKLKDKRIISRFFRL